MHILQLRNTLAIVTLFAASALSVRADDLRNVKCGERFPSYKLPAIDGSVVDSDALKGSITVIVCLSAQQKNSESAAVESLQLVKTFASDQIKIVYMSADAAQAPYFEKFRQEQSITAPLAFDTDRTLYGQLGLIAFPTTIVVSKEGNLDNAIFLHASDYKTVLEASLKHALGKLSDKQLADAAAASPMTSTTKGPSSAHRSLARIMREQGDRSGAMRELNKGLEIDPNNREIMLDLVDLNMSAGDLDRADSMLQNVLKAQPDNQRAKQLNGIYLFRRGNLAEAQTVLEQCLLHPMNSDLTHYYLGRVLEQKGDKDHAIEHYREALKHQLHEVDPAPAPKETK